MWVVALILGGAADTLANGANYQFRRQGRLEIIEGLTVTEISSLHFGKLFPATGGNTFITLYEDNTINLQGGGAHVIPGSPRAGVYLVAGEANRTVSASLSYDDFADGSIAILWMRINGSPHSWSGNLGADAEQTLRVGGRVRVSSDATPGVHQTNLYLTVNYQ